MMSRAGFTLDMRCGNTPTQRRRAHRAESLRLRPPAWCFQVSVTLPLPLLLPLLLRRHEMLFVCLPACLALLACQPPASMRYIQIHTNQRVLSKAPQVRHGNKQDVQTKGP